ncbi:Uncharacterized protein DAT39_000220 [Clarias magur]|uniref:Uncharacterized protein n=1 Tax=Clarias magur TaxID=1594786 RepID=A0A8J4XH85_CLAMG|nr:Uncharacterized protein DAT39_000220 [Clarias magur]
MEGSVLTAVSIFQQRSSSAFEAVRRQSTVVLKSAVVHHQWGRGPGLAYYLSAQCHFV